MQKPISILLSEEADDFLSSMEAAVRKKFGFAFEKTQAGFRGDWFKKMTGTAELWEFSVDGPRHTYRLFAFWDKRGATQTLIVCTHGLDKKTQRTPSGEITKKLFGLIKTRAERGRDAKFCVSR